MMMTRVACAQHVPQTDTQVWTEFDFAAALTPRAELTVPVIVRTSSSLPNPVLVAPGALLDYKLDPHLTFTGGYLFADVPHSGRGFEVHVPLAAVTGRVRVWRVMVSDRNRAEILEGFPQAPIRYRNRLTLDLQSPARPKWHAFLSDEAFYDFSAHAWTQNRFQAGVGKHLAERWSLDLYYLLRNVRAARPGQVNVLGTTLTFRIR